MILYVLSHVFNFLNNTEDKKKVILNLESTHAPNRVRSTLARCGKGGVSVDRHLVLAKTVALQGFSAVSGTCLHALAGCGRGVCLCITI